MKKHETVKFLTGAASKLAALLATYPLQVIKSRTHARDLLDGYNHDDSKASIQKSNRLINMVFRIRYYSLLFPLTGHGRNIRTLPWIWS